MFGSYSSVLAVIIVSDYIERWWGGGGCEGGGEVRNVEITEFPPHVRPLIVNPDPSKVLPLKPGVFLCPVVKRNLISNTWIFFVLQQSEPEQSTSVTLRTVIATPCAILVADSRRY